MRAHRSYGGNGEYVRSAGAVVDGQEQASRGNSKCRAANFSTQHSFSGAPLNITYIFPMAIVYQQLLQDDSIINKRCLKLYVDYLKFQIRRYSYSFLPGPSDRTFASRQRGKQK